MILLSFFIRKIFISVIIACCKNSFKGKIPFGILKLLIYFIIYMDILHNIRLLDTSYFAYHIPLKLVTDNDHLELAPNLHIFNINYSKTNCFRYSFNTNFFCNTSSKWQCNNKFISLFNYKRETKIIMKFLTCINGSLKLSRCCLFFSLNKKL